MKSKIEKNKSKSYTLKPPFEVKCMDCKKDLVVNFVPPRQEYSKKNNWGYWGGRKENNDKYKCDSCLVDMYTNRKYEYLEAITDSKKRRLLRHYLYDERIILNKSDL